MKPSNILTAATQFAIKVSLAQVSGSAQPSEIDKVLTAARVRPTTNDIAPLLSSAKVPDNISISIRIVVDAKLNVAFVVTANPANNSATTLKAILDRKYALAMKTALQRAGITVSDKMPVDIARFVA
jgi:hypothetical protein